MTELEAARSFWDKEVRNPTHNGWMAHPTVRHYINELISGDKGGWPFDWFQATYPNRRFPHGLSVGCGTGALERDVLNRGICDTMDAFDGSTASLDIARSEASATGLSGRIHYFAADFNRTTIPRAKYDIVFFHQSLHHVSRLERLLRQVLVALKPGGLMYLDEYVGPSRTYWNDRTVAPYRAIYQFLPRHIRYWDEFQLPIQYEDLSEAIRSGEIISRLRIGFTIRHHRGYGGNVVAMMFPDINVDLLTDEIVQTMIASDRSVINSGEPSFHAILVAEPKSGFLGRLLAVGRYLAEPKLRRIGREVRGMFRGRGR
jgi:SAM-dependent methyltransferase